MTPGPRLLRRGPIRWVIDLPQYRLESRFVAKRREDRGDGHEDHELLAPAVGFLEPAQGVGSIAQRCPYLRNTAGQGVGVAFKFSHESPAFLCVATPSKDVAPVRDLGIGQLSSFGFFEF